MKRKILLVLFLVLACASESYAGIGKFYSIYGGVEGVRHVSLEGLALKLAMRMSGNDQTVKYLRKHLTRVEMMDMADAAATVRAAFIKDLEAYIADDGLQELVAESDSVKDRSRLFVMVEGEFLTFAALVGADPMKPFLMSFEGLFEFDRLLDMVDSLL